MNHLFPFLCLFFYGQYDTNVRRFIGVPTIHLQMAVLCQILAWDRTTEEENDQPTHVRNYGRRLKGKLSNIGQGECLNSLLTPFLHEKVVAVTMTGCLGHSRNYTAGQRK